MTLQDSVASSDSRRFPRTVRLLAGADFQQVFRRNRRHKNGAWLVLAHRKSEGCARMGLAIAKKKAKRAVDRNRLKRVARESFRHHQELLVGFDVVVMNLPGADSLPTEKLRSQLDAVWLLAAQ